MLPLLELAWRGLLFQAIWFGHPFCCLQYRSAGSWTPLGSCV